MENEKMIDRITALITKANAEGVTEHESEALMAKAYELMERYRVDDAMLASRAGIKFKPTHKLIVVDGTYAKGRRYLSSSIVFAMGLTGVYTTRVNPEAYKAEKAIDVFGFESDLEVFQMLYTSLLLQASSGVLQVKGYSTGDTRSLRNGFWFGFADRVRWRMTEAKKTVAKETTGSELVFVGRKAELDMLRRELYPNLRKVTTPTVNRRGYAIGDSAGNCANLHDKKSTGVGSRVPIGG